MGHLSPAFRGGWTHSFKPKMNPSWMNPLRVQVGENSEGHRYRLERSNQGSGFPSQAEPLRHHPDFQVRIGNLVPYRIFYPDQVYCGGLLFPFQCTIPNPQRRDPTLQGGDPTLLRGFGSFQRGEFTLLSGDSTLLRGYASLQGGDPTLLRGDPTLQGGFTSLQGGDPTLLRGDPALQGGDPALLRGHPTLHGGDPTLLRGDPPLPDLRVVWIAEQWSYLLNRQFEEMMENFRVDWDTPVSPIINPSGNIAPNQ